MVTGCGGDPGDGAADGASGGGTGTPAAGGAAGDDRTGAGSLLIAIGTDGPPRLRAVTGDGSGAGRDVLAGVWVEDFDRSPDGRLLAVDIAHVPSMPGFSIACVAWSPDGRSLAVADLGAVDVYDRGGGPARRLFEPGWPEGPGCPVQWRAAPLGAGPGIG